jgi:hypothetical protein
MIPRSRFEVAWLSLSFESLAPVTPAAGSLILFCNHFLHRLVLSVYKRPVSSSSKLKVTGGCPFLARLHR